MRLKVLSRSSALAVVQAESVAHALRLRWPDLDVQRVTRSSQGDRDRQAALWKAAEKGLFTADLSEALVTGEADIVVHSWKDLPITGRVDTVVAGALERADVRDVLLVRHEVVAAAAPTFTALTSSPRRAWQMESSLRALLPWKMSNIRTCAIRGNVPTRLAALAAGDGDALVVAKAALDRLLAPGAAAEARDAVRAALERCQWMVLPVSQFPAAPAQGALAIEVAAARADVIDRVRAISHAPTVASCGAERAILESYGGGCHEAIGATVLLRDYGSLTSVRGRIPDGGEVGRWSLDRTQPAPPAAPVANVWPRPGEPSYTERHPVAHPRLTDAPGWWVARADAWPTGATVRPGQLIWAAGTHTWSRLAARGIWVHGCADGLGDDESPNVDVIAGRAMTWPRLTHQDSGSPDGVATYRVHRTLPADLASRTHFYWASGSLFLEALRQFPSIADGWHASGPGRTSRVIRATLGDPTRASIWLDYHQWTHHILG